MECHRCKGFMVQEKFYGPGDPFWAWKCVICGEIIDPLILDNRHHGGGLVTKRMGARNRNGRK